MSPALLRKGMTKILIKQLQAFQLDLKTKKKNMPLVDNAIVAYNGGPQEKVRLTASEGKISIDDKLMVFVTKTIPIEVENDVKITYGGLNITIYLENNSAQTLIGALGTLESQVRNK
jgi:predicted RNA-binding protein Jag